MQPIVSVLQGPLDYADAPFWHDKTNSLYYVNVYQSEIHKYDPETHRHAFAKVGMYLKVDLRSNLIID